MDFDRLGCYRFGSMRGYLRGYYRLTGYLLLVLKIILL